MRRSIVIGSVVVCLVVVVFLFVYSVVKIRSENRVLKEAVKKYEEMVNEREIRIKELESYLAELKRRGLKLEKEIAEKRKKREEIKKPVTHQELVQRFRVLGYEVWVE